MGLETEADGRRDGVGAFGFFKVGPLPLKREVRACPLAGAGRFDIDGASRDALFDDLFAVVAGGGLAAGASDRREVFLCNCGGGAC